MSVPHDVLKLKFWEYMLPCSKPEPSPESLQQGALRVCRGLDNVKG